VRSSGGKRRRTRGWPGGAHRSDSGELDAAWDLWFDLAQTTNDADPPYTHGVFADREMAEVDLTPPVAPARGAPLP
jgi:hypothetical protein